MKNLFVILIIALLASCNNSTDDYVRIAPETTSVDPALNYAVTREVQEERKTKQCVTVGECRVCIIHIHINWGGGITEDHYEITKECGSGLQTVYYWNTFNKSQ